MKNLLKLYVDETQKLKELEDSFNTSMRSINEDNQIWSIVPYSYTRMVLKLLRLTESQEDWLNWWMWEDTKGVSDETGQMNLDSFDDFYAFVFENKTVSEIQCVKVG